MGKAHAEEGLLRENPRSTAREVWVAGKNAHRRLGSSSGCHPWDPHVPSFSRLLPNCLRPFPSFEGWYTRIVDPVRHFSVAVILASNYATGESQVTLLFAPPSGQKVEGGRTYALDVRTKDAKIIVPPNDFKKNPWEPQGFEWEANDIGKIVVNSNETHLEVNIQGYILRAQLTKKLAWNPLHPEEGPEGWVRRITYFPTHWYVYSLGSKARYTFQNMGDDVSFDGEGYSHQEKNWGQSFPAGHVWLQALSDDNSSQLVCAGAYFKIGSLLATPYVFALGYRSRNQHIDMRSNDLGIWFHEIKISAKTGRFSVTGRSLSYTIEISAYAAPGSLSNPILAPIGKVDWKPACRESFLATVTIKVYKHFAWGLCCGKKLMEERSFQKAALEFGEDLLHED